jgi:Patatin-like phospholipase
MSEPVKLERVLWDELKHLGREGQTKPDQSLEDLYAHVGALPDDQALASLSLSGGGIRSATFNLGIIQALAQLGVLTRLDYLSSVSGGGYIAGWLKAWLHREPIAQVAQALKEPARRPGAEPLSPEPQPIVHLREFSNYLTPQLGFFSADSWTAGALILRNLILNWLVLVPALTAIVAIPQVALLVAVAHMPDVPWGVGAVILALAFALWASIAIYYFRRRRDRPASEPRILWLGVLPLWVSSLMLCVGALWLGDKFDHPGLALFSALWCIGVPLIGWLVARAFTPREIAAAPWLADFSGIVLSGAVAAVLMFALTCSWLPVLRAHPRQFVLLAVPILLGLYLLARVLFVAFASLGERDLKDPPPGAWTSEHGQAEREWWARLSGWVLLLCIAWIGVSALVLLPPVFIPRITTGFDAAEKALVGSGSLLTLLSGLATAVLGAGSATPANDRGTRDAPSPVKNLLLQLLAPLTVASIVLTLSSLGVWAERRVTGVSDLLRPGATLPMTGMELMCFLLVFLSVPATCTLLSWALGWVVNVNRFSFQGLYRNRLIRAYLGASNPKRAQQADPFTDFAAEDNLRLHELARGASPRPLSVINVTLNLSKSSHHLAWQQRKAESFSLTPLYCGNLREGYRSSVEYGGAQGITLGTAVAISGAAANPNAGYHTSPLVAFLMTLFNVRLGSWLGNPNAHGEKVYRLSGPRHAWKPLFADLFGQTDSHHAYVSLSDGGHFENLGLYEMVLRRSRFAIVSDAGEDPHHNFEDLANAIRKVRIDFGVPIEFDKPIRILARSAEGQHGLLCALGRIRYDLIDKGAAAGQLLYIKPTLLAEGRPVPYDVFGYSRASQLFPHEPTSNQWFSEAQFESYRALGQHLASLLGTGQKFTDLPSLFQAIEKQLATESAL